MPARRLACLVLGIVLLTLVASVARAQVSLLDLDGRAVDPLAPTPGVRATAFVFTTTDCPIANRYAPEVRRLYERFTTRGIRFWLVYVNPRESAATVRAHAETFDYPLPVLLDPRHELVRRVKVSVTPEVAVIDARGETAYRGRIDDRYADFGVDRPVATRREFEDALSAVLAGRPVPTPSTRAVGCFLADFRPVSFATDVAPIIFAKCAECHRPTGPAPFSLISFADVRQRASQIAAVTERRYMPPWKAESDAGSFVGQKRLSAAEIALIRRWVDEGAVEGDPQELPPLPQFADGWQLGTPDLVVKPEPFVLGPEPTDVFRIFVIRLPVSRTRFVRGLEFQPGNRVVHHANIRLDHTPTSRQLDDKDSAPGYDGLMARTAVYPEGHFLGWTPGQVAPLVGDRMAWRLDPDTDLVVQLHLQPSGAPEQVQPVIGLFFASDLPTTTPTILRLGSQGIEIPPGANQYIVSDSYTLPASVELHALQPHAHYRLRHVRGSATLPDGRDLSLIRIDDWDFRWQHVYRFEEPIVLPKGTRVSMRYTYDNSADNPRNPQLPPARVFWGQRSIDEMGDLWFQFVAPSDRDRVVLTREIDRKMTGEDAVGYETMLRANPDDTELHDDVALLYLSMGRAAEAVRHFRASARLTPDQAASHFNLATALSVEGLIAEALLEYREALRLKPGYSAAHNNLASVLASIGRADEAIPHFREAARLDSSNVQAHRNLAWYLATSRALGPTGAKEAVAAAELAVRLTAARDPQALDALAAAYAAAGEFDRAAQTATRALTLVQDETLGREIRQRLALYESGRPYRRP
ncbi:MAG: tetratricopeptide repeat protein [Acidobacteriota bacterium]